jgi:hypothetical protein
MHPQVDTVAQGARHAAGVSIHDRGLAAAPPVALTGMAARTWVHGCDELESGREDGRPANPSNRNLAVLERLAERFQRPTVEFGQLVEKKYPVVRQRDLAG